MRIALKSPLEIEAMRRAGRVVRQTLDRCRGLARPGVTTAQLDQLAWETFTAAGAVGLFKNYPTYEEGQGFPGHTCISVNDEVVHGIPGPRVLCAGDVVSIDCGVRVDGWCGDSAITVALEPAPPELRELIRVTEETLRLAIRLIRPHLRWSDVAGPMQQYVERHGFSCVREFVGHGIGRRMHEDPKVPNFVSPEFLNRDDFYLREGMTLAIEPMVIRGRPEVAVSADGWTVVTRDHSCAAHVEHTVAVTRRGCEILTNGN